MASWETTVTCLLAFCFTCASTIQIGVLSNHKPSAWPKSCTDDSKVLLQCNLELYKVAVKTGKKAGVDLLVFPEGYGLGSTASKSDFYEDFDPHYISAQPNEPCQDLDADKSPAQVTMSCMAKQHNISLAMNVFTSYLGKRYITEITIDNLGKISSYYHKHHLFPTEAFAITSGPFKPTVFEALGHKFGVIICYEGVYPSLTGDYSQMNNLTGQNVSAFVWSVGTTGGTMKTFGTRLAKKFSMPVIMTEDYDFVTPSDSGFLVDATGKEYSSRRILLENVSNYSGQAALKVAGLNF